MFLLQDGKFFSLSKFLFLFCYFKWQFNYIRMPNQCNEQKGYCYKCFSSQQKVAIRMEDTRSLSSHRVTCGAKETDDVIQYCPAIWKDNVSVQEQMLRTPYSENTCRGHKDMSTPSPDHIFSCSQLHVCWSQKISILHWHQPPSTAHPQN